MNRQKRGVPYAQRRLEGRTDSDTFFSSIKSVRGFKCVQLFVHLISQYLWISLLRREKDNHGAYQDFIREVGTPNVLLTDNAQSQVGNKWKETSRSNLTQQKCSAPDKQNQNQSERKIGDVKRRTAYTLFASQAPILFWCYCLQFVVYCLNLTARRRLQLENINGSSHRFHPRHIPSEIRILGESMVLRLQPSVPREPLEAMQGHRLCRPPG